MVGAHMCDHDWPGSSCPECRAEREAAASPLHFARQLADLPPINNQQQKETKTMATETIKIVAVTFASSRQQYHYQTNLDLAVGDMVVVGAPTTGYTVVKVASVDETVTGIETATKWVVCKVDDTEYTARIERAEKRALILAKLKKEQARVLSENQFAELAKVSPAAAELVKELQDLG